MAAAVPDYFSLFGLSPRFALDQQALSRAYDQVLGMVHPDRHVSADAAQRRAAMQMASLANEAVRVLRSDTARASYLCQLHGINPQAEGGGPLPSGFLEQQMQWHEELDEAKEANDPARLQRLHAQIQQAQHTLLADLALALDANANYELAAKLTRALMFLDKLGSQFAGSPT